MYLFQLPSHTELNECHCNKCSENKILPNLRRGEKWSGQHAEHAEPERMGLLSNVVMTNGGQHKAGVAVNNTHYYNEYGIT